MNSDLVSEQIMDSNENKSSAPKKPSSIEEVVWKSDFINFIEED